VCLTLKRAWWAVAWPCRFVCWVPSRPYLVATSRGSYVLFKKGMEPETEFTKPDGTFATMFELRWRANRRELCQVVLSPFLCCHRPYSVCLPCVVCLMLCWQTGGRFAEFDKAWEVTVLGIIGQCFGSQDTINGARFVDKVRCCCRWSVPATDVSAASRGFVLSAPSDTFPVHSNTVPCHVMGSALVVTPCHDWRYGCLRKSMLRWCKTASSKLSSSRHAAMAVAIW